MTEHDLRLLVHSLQGHEGFRRHPYLDTVGKLTVGYGRNLDDQGITQAEALILLANDAVTAVEECERAFRFWHRLDPVRQRVLAEMAVNMGLPRVRGFRKMLAALEAGDYDRAAEEMVSSKWSQQVGKRAQTLKERMQTGVD